MGSFHPDHYIMKRIFLLSLFLLSSIHLISQVNWIKNPEPVMLPGASGEWDHDFIAPGSVIYYDGAYHMWYAGGDFVGTVRIGHATSPDGIKWTKNPNNPVMDPGPEGAWDENTLFGCKVLLVDTIFHMWYTGNGGPVLKYENYRIGHATSPDGITWTKDPHNPLLNMGPAGS